MANALYNKGKQRLGTAQLDLTTATLKACLITNAYSFSAAHEFRSSLTTIGTDQTLTSVTFLDGVLDAADVTFPSVPAGSTVIAVGIYRDTGSAATSPVLAYIDTITGFPVVTNGGSIQVQWDNGALKIFSL